VYDEIVGVVDHTNYLILGITVALAWELPSKPPSEELDDLLTKLEDGTIDISRNDTVSSRRQSGGEQLGVGMPKLDRYPMVNLVCARAIENGQAFRPAEA